MKITALAFCLCAALLAACASTPDGEKKPVQDYRDSALVYLPLEVGRQWIYTVDYLGQAGELIIEIVRQEGDWFVDNRGTMLTADHRGIRDKDRYLLTFPLQESRSWVAFITPTRRETRTILSVDTSVETPAGNFEGAVAVETAVEAIPEMTLKSVHYFVPRVGIVKIETFLEDVRSGAVKRQTVTLLKSTEKKSAEKN